MFIVQKHTAPPSGGWRQYEKAPRCNKISESLPTGAFSSSLTPSLTRFPSLQLAVKLWHLSLSLFSFHCCLIHALGHVPSCFLRLHSTCVYLLLLLFYSPAPSNLTFCSLLPPPFCPLLLSVRWVWVALSSLLSVELMSGDWDWAAPWLIALDITYSVISGNSQGMTERSVGGGGSCYVCVLVNIAGCVFHPCLLHKHTVCVLGGHSSSRLCPFFFFYIKLWLQWDSAVQGRMRKGWCWLYRGGGEGVEKINVWVPCELDSHGFLFALLTIPTIPISLHCCTVYHLVALIVFGFCGQKAVFWNQHVCSLWLT